MKNIYIHIEENCEQDGYNWAIYDENPEYIEDAIEDGICVTDDIQVAITQATEKAKEVAKFYTDMQNIKDHIQGK